MNPGICKTPLPHSASLLAATLGALLLSACGGDDGTPPLQAVSAQQACTTLSGRTIAGAALTAAMVPASGTDPTYCNVTGTIAPALNFAFQLPDAWNGKLYYVGGGGYNGMLYAGISAMPALKQGYATAASDSGHQGSPASADFALTDTFAAQLFGSLSVPTVMSTALETVTAGYGTPPSKSYFEGCSGGGREALMAVQRNPELFDGVIARAPGYNWVGFMGAFNRTAKALAAPGGAFSPAKSALLAKHVRDTCDNLDGVVDGVVSNPAACTPAVVNAASLRCAGGADTGDTCLSDAQLAAVTSWTTDSVFTGSSTFRSKGYNLTGNEDDPAWVAGVTGGGNVDISYRFLLQDTTVKNYLARDPSANSLTYTWDQNQNALHAMAALNDATNPDIRPFINSGGKLIFWHGGSDPMISVNSTAEYIANMRSAVGAAAADASTRFYVAPGVNHCWGGSGADTTDLLTALDRWATNGTAPATLIAEKRDLTGALTFTRPLCQYPQYPRYTGTVDDAEARKLATNYTCTSP